MWWISNSFSSLKPKLSEKQKASSGQFPTQSRKEMDTKVVPRQAWKTFLFFLTKSPMAFLWCQEKGGSGEGREPTVPHPPHQRNLFLPTRSPPLSCSELLRLFLEKLGFMLNMEPNTAAKGRALGLSWTALGRPQEPSQTLIWVLRGFTRQVDGLLKNSHGPWVNIWSPRNTYRFESSEISIPY